MDTRVKQCPISGSVDCNGPECAWWVNEYRWKKSQKEGERDVREDSSGCAVVKIAEKLRGWRITGL